MNKYKRYIGDRKMFLHMEKVLWTEFESDAEKRKYYMNAMALYSELEEQRQNMNFAEKILTFIMSGEWRYWKK